MIADSTHRSGPGADLQTSCNQEWVEEHPFTSVTVAWGLGIAVGLLVGHTLAEAAGHRMLRHDTFTENLTSSIRELVKSSLPKEVSHYFS